jgi:hypothetical protein
MLPGHCTVDLCLEGSGRAVHADFPRRLFLCRGVADAVYLALGATVFFVAFHNARRRGALLQMGE